MSHPAWVCGLKLYNRFHECSAFWVTPCVGVWIETIMHPRQTGQGIVTPCVGVWIETGKLAPDTLWTLSHPAWVCGLKQ